MARLIMILMIPIVIIGLLTGCGKEEAPANNKFGFLPVEKIEVKVNEEFTIKRGFDLNSGYIWRESFDETMLELLDSEITTETKEDGLIVLFQVFHFKGKQKGNTQILLAHIRSSLGGNEVRTQEVFDIFIK